MDVAVSPITNPARLIAAPSAGSVVSEGGHIVSFAQPRGQWYWRVYSDKPTGGWLTAARPRNSAWAQEALSLPPGNNASMIQRVWVPEGWMLQRSRALKVREWNRIHGGGEQFRLLPRPGNGPDRFLPDANFEPGVPFK